MRCYYNAALLVMAIKGIASADAETFSPVPDFAPSQIVFDQPPGEFDNWLKALPCGANRATVTMQFDSFAPHEKWAPSAKLQLNPTKSDSLNDQTHETFSVGFSGPGPHYGSAVFIQKSIPRAAAKFKYVHFSKIPNPMKVDLAWESDGTVTATFAEKQSISFSMEQPITTIGVVGSSAKVEFLNLMVGHAGPPAECPPS